MRPILRKAIVRISRQAESVCARIVKAVKECKSEEELDKLENELIGTPFWIRFELRGVQKVKTAFKEMHEIFAPTKPSRPRPLPLARTSGDDRTGDNMC